MYWYKFHKVCLLVRNFESLQEVTISNFFVKLTWNPPCTPGWNKKEMKRKTIFLRSHSYHRGIQVTFTNKIAYNDFLKRPEILLNYFCCIQFLFCLNAIQSFNKIQNFLALILTSSEINIFQTIFVTDEVKLKVRQLLKNN